MVRKVKEKLGKQIFKNSVGFLTLIFFMEIILRINLSYKILDWDIFRIFISSCGFGIVLGLISSLFKKTGSKVFKTIISVALTLYAWIEVNLYNYLGFFMGTGNAEQGTKVVDYIKEYIEACPCDDFVILDDCWFDFIEEGLMDHIIHTNESYGLRQFDIDLYFRKREVGYSYYDDYKTYKPYKI